MTNSPEESYIQNYQKHLKHQSSFDDYSKGYSNQSASTKHLTHYIPRENCTICMILNKTGDLFKILNQGLFFKYTASQDYFYTRDINALLLKKRRAFCIRYFDTLIFDECKERLKVYFPKKEAVSLLVEIKDFYCHFKVFPKNFHPHFYKIMESNIKKHRHLEYIKVFDRADLEDEENTEIQSPQDPKDTSKGPKENQEFNILDMLGNSFLRDNYRDVSGVMINGLSLERRRDTERLQNEIDFNFQELDKVPKEVVENHTTDPFSNALYNNNYMLYSRNDSETAGDMLKQIVQGFKDEDFSKKVSTSLAEKVLQQKIVKKIASTANKGTTPSAGKQRLSSGNNFVQLVQPATTKGPLTLNNFSAVVNLQQLKKKPNKGSSKNLSANRGSSNPRSTQQIDNPNNLKVLAKDNQERVIEHKRTASKLAMENVSEITVSREKIIHKIDQFRSTRSKSGALKTILSTNKSDSVKGAKVITFNYESSSSKNTPQSAYFAKPKSQSPSPERRSSRDYDRQTTAYTEVGSANSKNTADSPYNNYAFNINNSGPSVNIKLKRTISGDFNGKSSGASGSVSHHKKSQSLIKRANAIAKTHQTTPSIQLVTNASNSMNMGLASSSNYPSVTQLSTKQSSNVKFVNLNTQGSQKTAQASYYFRHPSPVDDYLVTETDNSQKSMERKIKVLNIKAMNSTTQQASTKKLENYRVATLSLSGRHNFSEISQLASSLLVSNKSFLVAKTKVQGQGDKKKPRKSEIDVVGKRVVSKRNSGLKRQSTAPLENYGGQDYTNKSSSATCSKKLELNADNYATLQNTKSPSREVLYSSSTNLHNLGPSTTSHKGSIGLKVNFTGSYSVKANAKEIKFPPRK